MLRTHAAYRRQAAKYHTSTQAASKASGASSTSISTPLNIKNPSSSSTLPSNHSKSPSTVLSLSSSSSSKSTPNLSRVAKRTQTSDTFTAQPNHQSSDNVSTSNQNSKQVASLGNHFSSHNSPNHDSYIDRQSLNQTIPYTSSSTSNLQALPYGSMSPSSSSEVDQLQDSDVDQLQDSDYKSDTQHQVQPRSGRKSIRHLSTNPRSAGQKTEPQVDSPISSLSASHAPSSSRRSARITLHGSLIQQASARLDKLDEKLLGKVNSTPTPFHASAHLPSTSFQALETPIKRPRGRPRKSAPAAISTQHAQPPVKTETPNPNVEISPSPSGLVTRAKARLSLNEEPSFCLPSTPSPLTLAPELTQQEVSPNTSESEIMLPLKRKRGRPPGTGKNKLKATELSHNPSASSNVSESDSGNLAASTSSGRSTPSMTESFSLRSDSATPSLSQHVKKEKRSTKKKMFYSSGLYSTSDKTQGKSKPKSATAASSSRFKFSSIFPEPLYYGQRLLTEERDFRLPFPLHRQLDELRTRVHAKRKPPPYIHIRTNHYFSRSKLAGEVPLCQCNPSSNCGENCMNRIVQYVCNPKACPCGDKCTNVSLGKRPTVKTDVAYYGDRGYGMRTLEPIPKNGFIDEYRGEIINLTEAAKRVNDEYKTTGNYYLLDYDAAAGEFLDGGRKGNITRFSNHSCDPNCYIEKWIVCGTDESRTAEFQIGLFALRDIEAGEELTYNYGWSAFKPRTVTGAPAAEVLSEACLCGSANCVRILGGKRTALIDSVPTQAKKKRGRPKSVASKVAATISSSGKKIGRKPATARLLKASVLGSRRKQENAAVKLAAKIITRRAELENRRKIAQVAQEQAQPIPPSQVIPKRGRQCRGFLASRRPYREARTYIRKGKEPVRDEPSASIVPKASSSRLQPTRNVHDGNETQLLDPELQTEPQPEKQADTERDPGSGPEQDAEPMQPQQESIDPEQNTNTLLDEDDLTMDYEAELESREEDVRRVRRVKEWAEKALDEAKSMATSASKEYKIWKRACKQLEDGEGPISIDLRSDGTKLAQPVNDEEARMEKRKVKKIYIARLKELELAQAECEKATEDLDRIESEIRLLPSIAETIGAPPGWTPSKDLQTSSNEADGPCSSEEVAMDDATSNLSESISLLPLKSNWRTAALSTQSHDEDDQGDHVSEKDRDQDQDQDQDQEENVQVVFRDRATDHESNNRALSREGEFDARDNALEISGGEKQPEETQDAALMSQPSNETEGSSSKEMQAFANARLPAPPLTPLFSKTNVNDAMVTPSRSADSRASSVNPLSTPMSPGQAAQKAKNRRSKEPMTPEEMEKRAIERRSRNAFLARVRRASKRGIVIEDPTQHPLKKQSIECMSAPTDTYIPDLPSSLITLGMPTADARRARNAFLARVRRARKRGYCKDAAIRMAAKPLPDDTSLDTPIMQAQRAKLYERGGADDSIDDSNLSVSNVGDENHSDHEDSWDLKDEADESMDVIDGQLLPSTSLAEASTKP